MNVVIQSSLSNIAIIFFMNLCIVILLNKKDQIKQIYVYIGMVFLVTISVITMFYLPIRYGGYHFDLRLIPLVFLAVRWGWKLAIPALFITSSWRLILGGEGSLPGVIFGMILPVFFVLVITSKRTANPNILFILCLISGCWSISDVPIIFLVPNGWEVFQEIVLIRYLSFTLTAFTLYLFVLDTEKQIKIREQLQLYAERDSLTGLYNNRCFQEKVKAYPSIGRRMYIIMIDIDHFKRINDTYGHLYGDQVLKDVATILSEASSQSQEMVDVMIGRYGGEEFILFLAAKTKQDMMIVVEGICKVIENHSFYLEKEGNPLHLTVSIGVSEIHDMTRLYEAIELADQSLYASKNNGRNQIIYADQT